MLSILLGLIVAGVSLVGLWTWRVELFVVLRGLLPLCFFLGGVIAVIAGLSSFGEKDTPEKRLNIKPH